MSLQVPFYRPDITDRESDEVVAVLRSGWLTTGPRVRQFEEGFAAAVGARHAVALNSCTAALHLAVEALNLAPGQGVLVPTLTFAATAEVVRYQGGIPILVDCDPATLNMDLEDAERKLERLQRGLPVARVPPGTQVVGMIVVHVGGFMMPMTQVQRFAARRGLWLVEDAAHAFPAAWRPARIARWQRAGEGTAAVTCFSFYANKTMTTGEGGMAVTDSEQLASRMRQMSLHGLSRDAWDRYSSAQWDYRIVAPGFKYNLTDIAAAIGVHQLARAEEMRQARQAIAEEFFARLCDLDAVELPPPSTDRIHAWHLFPIKLHLQRLTLDRAQILDELAARGVRCSVHWRPLHLHPYYVDTFGWQPADLPVASKVWPRLLSLPLFSSMRRDEVEHVIAQLVDVCQRARLHQLALVRA